MASERLIRQKVVMLGTFAVGKTSLVRRFVQGIFSDRYLTTVGVKVDKRAIQLDGVEVSMIVWDLHGEDDFQKIRSSYLRGSGGYFLVADGTRAHTLTSVRALQREASGLLGIDTPFTLLLNKADLRDAWEVQPGEITALEAEGWKVVETSAKSGDGVESAFEDLARRILASTTRPGP